VADSDRFADGLGITPIVHKSMYIYGLCS